MKKMCMVKLLLTGAVMLFGWSNIQAVQAADWVEQYEMPKETEEIFFSTFEELKALTEETYTESTQAFYMNTEALEIKEDITIPDNLVVNLTAALQVNKDVELTIAKGARVNALNALVVDGMIVNAGYLHVDISASINGFITNEGTVDFECGEKIAGESNILCQGEYPMVICRYNVDNVTELKVAREYSYFRSYTPYWVNGIYVKCPIHMDESHTFAKGVHVVFHEDVKIDKSYTLKIDQVDIWGEFVVEGTFETYDENSRVTVFYDVNDVVSGILRREESGAIEGYGTIRVNCQKDTDYKLGVPGLDLSNYVAYESEDSGLNHYWELKHVEFANPFADVPEDQWYYPYVKKAWRNGLMSGVDTTEDGLVVFSPETLMTRAMFVQVLYGIHGKPEVAYAEKFDDVLQGQWYTSAVLWAAENGITSGVSATEFGVNQNITREQMALMLMKYAELIGADVSGRADMDAFVDWESVSSWAKDAMQWAVANGIMSGEAGGKLNPQGIANRAVGATMFNAFYEKVK